MPEAALIRRITFSAGHHYLRPDRPEEWNRRHFGASMTPHGHNYAVEVTVRGEVDSETGFVVDLVALDRLLREEVVERMDQQDLNQAIPEVREGAMVPSTESLATWLWARLHDRIPPPARLHRVRVEESDTLAAEVVE